MLKVSVCPAVYEDAEAIAELNASAFGRSCPLGIAMAQLKAILKNPDEKLFVAVYRGSLIGYVHARTDRRTYRAAQKAVLALAVEKQYRRQGVGRALFEAVLQWAKDDGCELVSAHTGSSKAAQCFFLACDCEERLNRKQYVKSVVKRSPIVERLEAHGKKE